MDDSLFAAARLFSRKPHGRRARAQGHAGAGERRLQPRDDRGARAQVRVVGARQLHLRAEETSAVSAAAPVANQLRTVLLGWQSGLNG